MVVSPPTEKVFYRLDWNIPEYYIKLESQYRNQIEKLHTSTDEEE